MSGTFSGGDVLETLKRLLFLDIDGVLNSTFFLLKRRSLDVDLDNEENLFDPSAISRLNRLLQLMPAQVVISSAWRRGRSLSDLRSLLSRVGVDADVIGKTPESPIGSGTPRHREISTWLSEHHRMQSPFVILDDFGDMGPWQCRLVQTNGNYGLLDDDVTRAVSLFR